MEKTAGYLAFALSAVYYILNRYPGLGFIDSGELALSSYSLGIPHPTGYPLYIILTRPATLFFGRPIEAVTIFSAVSAGLTVFVFYHLVTLFIRDLLTDPKTRTACSFILSLIFAAAPVIAAQGTTNEVYGLSLLINLTLVLLITRYFLAKSSRQKAQYLFLISYLTGLTLTNHLQGVIFVPVLVWMLWNFRRHLTLRPALLLFYALTIPLTLYFVPAIRASMTPPPVANWGDMTSWDNFYRHVTGWQYSVWMFSSDLSELWRNFISVLNLFRHQLPPILWLMLPFGFYATLKSHRKTTLIIILLMAINLFIGVNYSIPDNEGYFLLSITLAGLMAFIGLIFILRYARLRSVIFATAAVMLTWQIILVNDDNYKLDYTLPEDYAVNIARSARYNALVMSNLWDHHGQLYYLQQAEYFRPDLKPVDMELLRRSWYYRLLENLYPDMYQRIDSLAPLFLNELKYFEGGEKYDAAKLDYYFQKIINRLLTSDYPAYIDYGLQYKPEGVQYFRRQGLLMRVDTFDTADLLPQPVLEWRGRPHAEYTDWRSQKYINIIRKFMK